MHDGARLPFITHITLGGLCVIFRRIVLGEVNDTLILLFSCVFVGTFSELVTIGRHNSIDR